MELQAVKPVFILGRGKVDKVFKTTNPSTIPALSLGWDC